MKKFFRRIKSGFKWFFSLETWVSSDPWYDEADEELRNKGL